LFFNETACRFHLIEAKCGFPRWCGYVWAVRAGQTGPGGDGGPWGSHVSYPSRHGRPLRSQVTTGRLNGLCVVVQYTPHAGQSVPMLNAPQMNTCGPPAADPTPPGPPGTSGTPHHRQELGNREIRPFPIGLRRRPVLGGQVPFGAHHTRRRQSEEGDICAT
jgi:hypothetical protein